MSLDRRDSDRPQPGQPPAPDRDRLIERWRNDRGIPVEYQHLVAAWVADNNGPRGDGDD